MFYLNLKSFNRCLTLSDVNKKFTCAVEYFKYDFLKLKIKSFKTNNEEKYFKNKFILHKHCLYVHQ